jgi:hypothetical protein
VHGPDNYVYLVNSPSPIVIKRLEGKLGRRLTHGGVATLQHHNPRSFAIIVPREKLDTLYPTPGGEASPPAESSGKSAPASSSGGTSQNILEHLEAWVLAREPGLVHINCGLHDLRKAFGAAEAAVPLKQYRTNVESMLRRMLARSGTRVIWATTTPILSAAICSQGCLSTL